MVERAEESVLGHKEEKGAAVNTPFNLDMQSNLHGEILALLQSRGKVYETSF